MKTFNAFLVTIASLTPIASLVAAEGRFSEEFSSGIYAREADVDDYLDFFPLSARDYSASLAAPDFDLHARDAYDVKPIYSRDTGIDDYPDFFPLSARDDTDSLTATRFDLYGRDAHAPEQLDAAAIFRRAAFPPVNHPSFPANYFADLPPSKPHGGAHRAWNDPSPPARPDEKSGSYFPPPGGSSSRIVPKPRGRAGSFRRSEVEIV
ncbi:hypothetical protein MMC26_004833 [Xylographa opegraphella]|nr:hypothetical protein [Xylographa opegraphella]